MAGATRPTVSPGRSRGGFAAGAAGALEEGARAASEAIPAMAERRLIMRSDSRPAAGTASP
jgi:hypothetical protein